MYKVLFVTLMFLFFGYSYNLANSPELKKDTTALNELQNSIQQVLTKTNTPGAGIVIISDNEIILSRGFGKADIEKDIDVDENTMFRLGSISKLFVGLAILKLQEEGQLSLKDTVSKLIPDIEIDNPWRDSHPIRIENLLEHTSGLDDWSLAELGYNNPKPLTLKESLEYYPKARVAKYVPGTRIKYSNLGVSIAAYIVERVSGLRYEDYIEKNFFKPIGIEDMTFLNSDRFKATGAKAYDNGVPLSIDYLNLIYRPSAALNGSLNDVTKALRFFINRGKIDTMQLISDSSFLRMEKNESLFASLSEIFNSSGFVNYATSCNGYVYRGHGGSVPGYKSNLCYMPEYNLGFAVMVNSDNEDVESSISRLIMRYQTENLPKKIVEDRYTTGKITNDISGYYIDVNYKFTLVKSIKKIKSLSKIWSTGDTLYTKKMLEQYKNEYHPIGDNRFISDRSGGIALFQIDDPVQGTVVYENGNMMKRVSSVYAYFLLVVFWALFIIPVTIVIFAIIRLLIYLIGKKRNSTALWINTLPLITILFFVIIAIAFSLGIQSNIDYFLQLGNISVVSLLLFICTLGFAIFSIYTLYYIIKNSRVKMSRFFYYHALLASLFNLIFTIYFLSNGLIGIMTWI
ncbi:MAG: beta-lactamase family protein [Bacteroidales bacterium]|jgi:CubicO group peptidase (beta-lactamase class C family)|nr:beta-lactamase family protein [Bacteroidales bacterium]